MHFIAFVTFFAAQIKQGFRCSSDELKGKTIEGQLLLLLLFVALIVMLLALKAKSKEKEIGILVKRTKSFSWPLQKIT